MKVLHLISGGDSGGAKTHVFALLSSLLEDIDLRIICFTDGIFYQEIQELPIPSSLMKQKFRYDMSVVKKLVKLIRKERYNIIHAHGARANFITLFLRPFIKVPIVTTIHSDYLLDFTQNLYKKILFTKLNTLSLKYKDYYIAVSQNFKDMLVERGFPEDKTYVVYNAIDFDIERSFLPKEDFLKKYNINADGKVLVGIIGRFDKVKGHDVFIKACSEVLKKNKNVLFLLAGDGGEEENLKKLCDELGIKENVMFLGFIKDIFSFINAIDINVLSSHSESFPYVILEGAIMKKATVSTAVGGIPDLIKDGETGFLATPNNPESLGEKILKMSESEEIRHKLGLNLYNYARENFSKDSLKNRHLEIYNDIMIREKEENRVFDVILSGYYGFNNSGDEAMLSAIVDFLKKDKEDIKILVLSKQPELTMDKYNVFAVYRYHFFKILQYFKRSRVFVNGGGSLLQDVTSTHSLIYYTFLIHLSKYYGLKVMLYSNGIGPLTKKYNRRRAKRALEISDVITLRDPESLEELGRLGVDKKRASLSADPTLATKKIPLDEVKKIFEKENIPFDDKYFALSFRQWKYNDIEFIEKISEVINYVYEKYGYKPLFIPMQHSNDLKISTDIIERCNCESYILKYEYAVKELLGVINETRFVISMRLHSLIYSVSVNTPIIGIVYDPKIKSFMEYAKQYSFVETSNIDVEKLKSLIDNIENNYDETKETLLIESNRLKELCYIDPKIAISLIDN